MEGKARVLLVDPEESMLAVLASPELSDVEWIPCVSLDDLPTPADVPDVDVLVTVLAQGDPAQISAPASRFAGHLPGIPWLAVMSAAAAGDVDRLIQAGANDILLAPVDPTELGRSIQRLLELRRLAVHNHFLLDSIRIMEDCRPLAHFLEPGQLYPLALEILLRATERHRGFVLFQREGPGQGAAVAVRGFTEAETPGFCRRLIDDKRVAPEEFEGVHVLDRGPLHDALRSAGVDVSSLLIVSMGGGGRSGVMAVFDSGIPFTARDVERAEIVGRHGIPALDNADTYASAKERAFVDDVTEAYNARYLLETCENEIRRSVRYGTPLSVLFLDLDRFKRVNDEFGHLAGSKMLRRLCRFLEAKVREVDTLARYGGDEFTILLVDTDHAEALAVADRIRQGVAAETFELNGEGRLGLTVSIGVSTCPLHAGDRDRLIDAADKAMYRAKSLGRNRVCSATELS